MRLAFKNSFLRALGKLDDVKLRNDIAKSIEKAEQADTLSQITNLKKLTGYTIYFRIRVGKYRIGLQWEEATQTLYFVTFGHRKDIYKIFP